MGTKSFKTTKVQSTYISRGRRVHYCHRQLCRCCVLFSEPLYISSVLRGFYISTTRDLHFLFLVEPWKTIGGSQDLSVVDADPSVGWPDFGT